MAKPISWTECSPFNIIRELSPEAISFYVDDLSGIYLPEEFKEKHADVDRVQRWEPEDRLLGKFGRYVLEHEDEEKQPENIILMGSTIGLLGHPRYGGPLDSLEHGVIDERFRHLVMDKRRSDKDGEFTARAADYGSTLIKLNRAGKANVMHIGGDYFHYGRADAEGRQETCDKFTELLGGNIEVINTSPVPSEHEIIIKPKPTQNQ